MFKFDLASVEGSRSDTDRGRRRLFPFRVEPIVCIVLVAFGRDSKMANFIPSSHLLFFSTSKLHFLRPLSFPMLPSFYFGETPSFSPPEPTLPHHIYPVPHTDQSQYFFPGEVGWPTGSIDPILIFPPERVGSGHGILPHNALTILFRTSLRLKYRHRRRMLCHCCRMLRHQRRMICHQRRMICHRLVQTSCLEPRRLQWGRPAKSGTP
jgi:hypothetical protein